MPTLLDRRQRLLDARERLVALLSVITTDAALSAPGRCPYRGACDACTFGFGCRNQIRDVRSQPQCGGGTLSPERVR